MNGFLYIATGDGFVDEASISAQSLRRQMPEASIAIVCDAESSVPDQFDTVIPVADPAYGFVDQIAYMDRTPFDKTIVVDTDIYFTNPVGNVFELLDAFDVAAAHNQNPGTSRSTAVPHSFPEYNTGVIAYRLSDAVRDFLDDWRTTYEAFRERGTTQNQPSFRTALFESDLRIATLPREYNAMMRVPGHVHSDLRIAHGRLLDIDTPGAGKYVSVTDAARAVNERDGHRVWTQAGGFAVYTNRDNRASYLRMGLRRYGVTGVIRRIWSRLVKESSGE